MQEDMIRFFGRSVEKGGDPAALQDSRDIESSPVIQRLESQFSSMLPPRFGGIRTSISPMANLQSVIRADCQNTGCGVRAYIHMNRVGGNWQFSDNPTFDRLQNAKCNDCKSRRW